VAGSASFSRAVACTVLVLLAPGLGGGCFLSRRPVGDGPAAGADAVAPDASTPAPPPLDDGALANPPPIDLTDPVVQVDLLVVADNSQSMAEEQDRLRAEIPRVIGVLLSGDLEFDPDAAGADDGPGRGEPDFPPVRRLRVGVVTTDLGAAGLDRDDEGDWECRKPDVGDDARLRTGPDLTTRGCARTYPAPLIFDDPEASAGPGDWRRFGAEVGCVVRAGTRGCGFEQPLEAAHRALRESFPPEGDFLVVLFVGDEDDCSAADRGLYRGGSRRYDAHFNVRCVLFPEALHPIERYVDGLLDVALAPQRLLVATIAGAPVPLVDATRREEVPGIGQDLRRLVADPAMTPEVGASGENVLPVCQGDDGEARPGRRLAEVARGIQDAGGNGLVESICRPSLNGTLDPLVAVLGRALAR
jgi:hypothetical protein